MSDDIVMRLRASSLAWRIALMPEAADEIGRLRSALDVVTRERNEARAEVENLYDQVHRWVDDRAKAQARADRLREQNYELQRERDEARAEVERLTGKLKLVADALNETISKYHEVGDQNDRLDAENERLREALHRVSLASQNSMSSKDECGRIAREVLEAKP